jgi:hypothetical protein
MNVDWFYQWENRNEENQKIESRVYFVKGFIQAKNQSQCFDIFASTPIIVRVTKFKYKQESIGPTFQMTVSFYPHLIYTL